MSVEQVIEEVERWSPEDREKLVRKLNLRSKLDDPEYMEELSRRADEMEAGRFVTEEQMKAILKEKRGLEF